MNANSLTLLRRFKVTTTLVLVLIISFMFMSGGTHFISAENVLGNSFGTQNPQNIVHHIFTHNEYEHLVFNLAAFALFALLVESAVGGTSLLVIFFASAFSSAIIFALLNPGSAIVGASGGISGLAASAFMLKTKKFFGAVVAMILITFLLLTAANFSLAIGEQSLQEQNTEIRKNIETAVAEGDAVAQEQLSTELAEVKETQSRIGEGKALQEAGVSIPLPHIVGALVGLLYVRAFRKKQLEANIAELREFFGKRKS